MKGSYLLGVDNGGTAVKAGLYDTNGKELALAKTSVTQIMPHDGWLERPMEEVWEKNIQVIREVVRKSGIDPQEILGVAFTGYGNGGFFVDERGMGSYPNGILSGDVRAKEYIKKWMRDGTLERINKKTHQSLWAGQTTPLMAWMVDNMPQVMEKTRYVLSCVDFLRYRMTGQVATEVSNASSISAMDLSRKAFDREVLKDLGLEKYIDRLPEKIIGSSQIGGYVTSEAAAQTGIPEGTPVMGGLFDITACAISTGLLDDSRLCVVLGTWSINEYVSQEAIVDPDFFMDSLYCIDGYYLHTEGSTTSASNLQWFVDNYIAVDAKAQGKDPYQLCEELLEQTPYDDCSILFLPFLYGTNVNLDAKAAFIGLNGRHTKGHMLRAVYEGIAFSHLYHIEKLRKHGCQAKAVRISGGGANSDQWLQIFADLLQLPIEVPQAKELGAMGVAMCVGVGAGKFDSLKTASAAFTRIGKIVEPNPEHYVYYQNKYQLYKDVIQALDTSWHRWDNFIK